MALHKIKKGLNLPISGQPAQSIDATVESTAVALLGDDYPGMKPRMSVQEGDEVKRGQPLFEDRKAPGVVFTAPAAGKVAAIHRGAKRVFQSLVIEMSDDERAGRGEQVTFASFRNTPVEQLTQEAAKTLLVESGLWTAFRTRPFSKVPATDTAPRSIFVTAIDTHPLAPDVDVVLAGREADFEAGLQVLSKLTEGTVFLCKAPGSKVSAGRSQARVEEFAGKHPAGTVGVHIHRLDPVHREKVVWHIGYQDVAAMGRLFLTGELDVERVVSLAGPPVKQPRLLRARLGARLADIVTPDALSVPEVRTISGSVLSGLTARGPVFGYLGRYHQQVSVLAEDRERRFLGWLGLGFSVFSIVPAFASALLPNKKFAFTTSTNGSPRAMVPIGMYERVMPMDIMPTHLLRALVVGDVEWAEQLGALELDEEDLALCTFVCPSKTDYGPALRNILNTIDKEG